MSHTNDWPWWKVKAEVERRGGSLTKIANEAGVTVAAVCQVKRYPAPRIQDAISAFLDIEPTTIWPTRYSEQGIPVRVIDWRRKFANEQRVA